MFFWMKAYLLRLFKHSSSRPWYESAKHVILGRLRKAGVDHSIIAEVDRTTIFSFAGNSVKASINGGSSSIGGGNRGECCSDKRSFWVKLPFHAAYASCVNRSLAEFSTMPAIQEILSTSGLSINRFRAAWCLDSLSLADVVRKY